MDILEEDEIKAWAVSEIPQKYAKLVCVAGVLDVGDADLLRRKAQPFLAFLEYVSVFHCPILCIMICCLLVCISISCIACILALDKASHTAVECVLLSAILGRPSRVVTKMTKMRVTRNSTRIRSYNNLLGQRCAFTQAAVQHLCSAPV